MKKFDEKLVKKAYGLISKKYSTEQGKKFILHLVSAFVINDCYDITIENSGNLEELECCITRCKVTPIDSPVPVSVGTAYHGAMSKTSNKILSLEALNALAKFILDRKSAGDNVISRIESYMSKKKNSSAPNSKSNKPKNKIIKESKAVSNNEEAIPPRHTA